MIHGPSFEEAEDMARMAEPVYRCPTCDRTFTEDTCGKMDDKSLPCPCGTQIEDFEKWMEVDHPELRYRAETVTPWGVVVDQVADSGFWRCLECGYTAPDYDWNSEGFGDEYFVACPRCRQVEDYEILHTQEAS